MLIFSTFLIAKYGHVTESCPIRYKSDNHIADSRTFKRLYPIPPPFPSGFFFFPSGLDADAMAGVETDILYPRGALGLNEQLM